MRKVEFQFDYYEIIFQRSMCVLLRLDYVDTNYKKSLECRIQCLTYY